MAGVLPPFGSAAWEAEFARYRQIPEYRHNQMLCSCEIQTICEFMTNPCGNVEIRQNAPGCNGPAELAGNCGITLNCRDFPDYFFSSQGEIDSFPVSFPDCSQLNGRIVICGDEIKDLRGLRGLSFINGDLSICNNKSLCNLTGLDNIYAIMGELKIYGNNSLQSLKGLDQLNYTWSDVCIGLSYLGNPILKSLTGLRNLNVIGGDLKISGNDSLSSLEGLDQLFSLWGQLVIVNNDALVSLAGIDNLYAGSISYLWIHNNYSLPMTSVAFGAVLGAEGGSFGEQPVRRGHEATAMRVNGRKCIGAI